MDKFYSGTVTIDEQLFLRKADDPLYKFIGLDMYAPLSDAIHQEDFHRFDEAIKELKDKDMSKNLVSVRLRRYDGKYRWVLMELSYEPFDIDGKAMLSIKITDLLESENNKAELRRITNEDDIYLGLLNGIMINYEISEGTLEIYMIGGGRHVYLYQGTFKNWKDTYMAGKIDAMSVVAFEDLCNDMQTGKKNFEHDIMCNAFSGKTEMELCRFKCQTIRSVARNYKVIGCVTMSSEENREVLLGTDFNKDVGIDVLNKKAITDYAKRAIATGGKKVYIAVLDLDHFKTINDTFGHLFGDEVLATTAEIIKEAVGNRGIVGRIGGDEMMIVIDRIEEHTELRNLLRTIRTNVEWAYKGKRDDVNVTCSIGVAAYPEHGDNYEKVFQIADKMLYLAKEKGRNRYIIYIPEIHDPKNATIRNEQNESKITALQNDKVGIMQRLIENFLIKKIVTNEMIFGEIGYGYGLDEILMLYENMSVALQWTETEICSDIRKISFFQPDEAFIEHFDKNKVFVMNGLFNLEGKSPQIASVLQEKGIESAVFYKITKMDQCVGYVMFARRSRRSMWSEYEIMVLSVIGKILELSVMDR